MASIDNNYLRKLKRPGTFKGIIKDFVRLKGRHNSIVGDGVEDLQTDYLRVSRAALMGSREAVSPSPPSDDFHQDFEDSLAM